MNTYGPPSHETRITRPHGVIYINRAKRAIAAAKNSSGWIRKSYLQSAIEHLSDVERFALGSRSTEVIEGLIRTTLEFYAVASEDELASAVAQVIRAYGVELDVSQAL